MSATIAEKITSIKNNTEYQSLFIYDTGAEIACATETEIEAWLIDVGSNWGELKISGTFEDFCVACIDAINNDFRDLNKMLGYSKNTMWDEDDIISKFEKITNIEI